MFILGILEAIKTTTYKKILGNSKDAPVFWKVIYGIVQFFVSFYLLQFHPIRLLIVKTVFSNAAPTNPGTNLEQLLF